MQATNHALHTPATNDQHNGHSGITEIVMPCAHNTIDENAQAMVLPMLAYLSQQSQDKWFTWIAPSGISKAVLANSGFDCSRVRLIHTHSSEESLWIFWDALANGNSSSVVANLDFLSEKDRQKLETASRIGNTKGLVLRSHKV